MRHPSSFHLCRDYFCAFFFQIFHNATLNYFLLCCHFCSRQHFCLNFQKVFVWISIFHSNHCNAKLVFSRNFLSYSHDATIIHRITVQTINWGRHKYMYCRYWNEFISCWALTHTAILMWNTAASWQLQYGLIFPISYLTVCVRDAW